MPRLLLAAGLMALAAAFSNPALSEETKLPRTLSLSGHGEAKLAPDMASVTIGVLNQADTARDALSANTAAMQAILASLTAAGVADKDIQTTNFMVQPRYDYNTNNQPPRLVGYDVSNNVVVTVRKLEGLGAILDRTVSAGSNQINGIVFQVSEPDAALDEARARAVADASRKAGVYAGAAKVELGHIMSISEGVSFEPPIPIRAKMLRADAAAADVPIAQGEQTLAVDVNIVWEIR